MNHRPTPRLITRRLEAVQENVFAGDLSIPPLMGAKWKSVPFFYEWDPSSTRITSVKMSWAAETEGWSPATGHAIVNCTLNGTIADRYEFAAPGIYSKTVDVTGLFFNGPNEFRLGCLWVPLPNVTWISCQVRVDLTITYEGQSPDGRPPELGQYAPWIVGGVLIGTALAIIWVKR